MPLSIPSHPIPFRDLEKKVRCNTTQLGFVFGLAPMGFGNWPRFWSSLLISALGKLKIKSNITQKKERKIS